MRNHIKTTLIIIAALAGAACWAFRSSGKSVPPSAEKLGAAELAEAVRVVEQALESAHDGSFYSGRQKFLKLASEPRRRRTNDETFRLLRSIRVSGDAQWDALRMKQDGEIGVLFSDERGMRISVVLQNKGGQLKVARAGTI